MTVRRYLLFAGEHYYPRGGWDDFRKSFRTRAEAESYVEARLADFTQERPPWAAMFATHCGWAHIIDGETGEKLASWGEGTSPDIAAWIPRGEAE